MKATQHRGESLDYIALEPDDYRPELPYPLVVMLHGYGSNMDDLAGLCPVVHSTGYRYVCPNAPISMQLGYGVTGHAWFSLDEGDARAVEEARTSENRIATLVEEVTAQYEVEPERVVLGGFSQGGMLTLQVGLTRPEVFRGLAVLSGKFPQPEELIPRLQAQREQSIFVSHGTADHMIAVEEGRQAVGLLKQAGYRPEYHEYEMGHQITADVVADLSNWLGRVLPPTHLDE